MKKLFKWCSRTRSQIPPRKAWTTTVLWCNTRESWEKLFKKIIIWRLASIKWERIWERPKKPSWKLRIRRLWLLTRPSNSILSVFRTIFWSWKRNSRCMWKLIWPDQIMSSNLSSNPKFRTTRRSPRDKNKPFKTLKRTTSNSKRKSNPTKWKSSKSNISLRQKNPS